MHISSNVRTITNTAGTYLEPRSPIVIFLFVSLRTVPRCPETRLKRERLEPISALYNENDYGMTAARTRTDVYTLGTKKKNQKYNTITSASSFGGHNHHHGRRCYHYTYARLITPLNSSNRISKAFLYFAKRKLHRVFDEKTLNGKRYNRYYIKK